MSGFSQLNPLPVALGGTGDTGSAWITASPTPTATSGTFTSASVDFRYKQIGKTVIYQGHLTITTIGSASGFAVIPLPVANAARVFPVATTRRTSTSVFGSINVHAGTSLSVDLTGAIDGSHIEFAGVYEAA